MPNISLMVSGLLANLLIVLFSVALAQNTDNNSVEIVRRQVFTKQDLKKSLTEAARSNRKVLLSCESDICPFSRIATKSLFNTLKGSQLNNIMLIKVKK
jgi:thioredoxin-related protein